jgi:hypothetical protein
MFFWDMYLLYFSKGALPSNDKSRIERRIEATDRQIDELVYRLYGLTKEEIAIVEGSAKGGR